jgi:dihydropteroate synthase type 2
MQRTRPAIVGIVNITPDSFSDGGLYLEAEKAIAHAKSLRAQGADVIELGAASSNPDAAPVSPEEEVRRLDPVLSELRAHDDYRVAVDSTQPEVQRYALERGVHYLNDIRGFPERTVYPALAASSCHVIVMHSIAQEPRAKRIPKTAKEAYGSIRTFFEQRIAQLTAAGIQRDRIILDPGMGFFLSSNPETSLAVLSKLPELQRLFGLPLMISVSRKSFLRNFKPVADCDIASRTLAAELFAAAQGVTYIRTHDARALAQALDTVEALRDAQAVTSCVP